MTRSRIVLGVSIAVLAVAVGGCHEAERTSAWKPAEYPPASSLWGRELPEDAKPLMPRFQQALYESDWEVALSCCSEHVRKAAAKYESPEAFFRAVVPIKDVVETRQYRMMPKGLPKRMYFVFDWKFRVPGIEGEHRRHWESHVYRTDTGWVIHFWSTPLETQIERIKADILREQSEEYREWKREWMRERERRRKALDVKVKSLRTRLTPLSEEFVLGEPMLFRLEVENNGEDELVYGRYVPLTFVDPLSVTDERGEAVSYIGPGASQFVYSGDTPIKPGCSVILLDEFDIANHYEITRPGRYKVQFTGRIDIGEPQDGAFCGMRKIPSNIVEIEVGR